jgi:predicted TIM-barrel fold metal-dependent hydrolase
MVIDFHVHCFPDELSSRAVETLAKRAQIAPRVDGTIDGIRRSMERSGVDCSVVLSIATKPSQTEKVNTWSASINKDGIIAFGSIHPEFEGWSDELRRIKGLGLKGIKFHPDYQLFYVDEERMFPIYELAAELGLIIVFHAGLDVGLPPPYHCTPERLVKVVKAFPGMKIVAAHMGGFSYWDRVEEFLVGQDIYLDTSYSFGWIGNEQARRIITNHDYKKVLFATDSPWTDQGEEISRLKDLNLGADIESAVLGGNAVKLLEL